MRLFWKIGIPGVVVVIIGLRLFVGEIANVPTGSMYPTLIIGDWVWVDKTAYGARLPRRLADVPILNVFTWIKPLREADQGNDWGYRRVRGKRMPRVNDIVVFESSEEPKLLLVKRITERLKAGDTVFVNSRNFYSMRKIFDEEKKDGFLRRDTVFIDRRPDSLIVLSQPYYFMLGDNRDNSADSRVFGYVPYSAVVGRTRLVFISVNMKRRFMDFVRWDRVMKRVE